MEYTELLEAVTADDIGKGDSVVTVGTVDYPEDHVLTWNGGDEAGRVRLTEWAFGQFCEKLGIPGGYMGRCPYELQKVNADHWLREHEGDEWLVRTKNTGDTIEARGVLSGSYMVINNREVVDNLGQADLSRANIRHLWLTDRKMTIRVSADDVSVEVDGRPIYAGVDIYNSEVGAHSLAVVTSLYQEICSNGLVKMYGQWDHYRRVHRGGQWGFGPEFGAILNSAVEQAVVLLDAVERSARTTKAVEEMVEVALKMNVGKRLVQAVVEETPTAINIAGQPSARVYDFVSALTNKAKEYDLSRRNELEALGMALTERLIT